VGAIRELFITVIMFDFALNVSYTTASSGDIRLT